MIDASTMSAPLEVKTETNTTIAPADAGGIVGIADTALAGNQTAALLIFAAILAFIAACFAAILACALAGNRVGQSYISGIFGATAVWVIVAGVLLGAAYLAPSPRSAKP